ncbi:hypothetical protein RND71_018563 [Anisodus tanguticus]|uniref:NB-ARC domain-containing protein n=1 Tax=Anisodus tanguticus TaxID=243964 RepID=A0AAE1VC70_9SOLA|nr:hypothetical protein RND71_018563 [Anisodus tanguticus]
MSIGGLGTVTHTTTPKDSLELDATVFRSSLFRFFTKVVFSTPPLPSLDDVWEAINLDHVGVPQPEDPTSRFWGVCKQMKTDAEINVSTLDEDESWQLFVKNAGDNANLEHIQPFAKEIARESDGLPLAITVIGASMSGKKRVELWKDALKSLRMSEPHN